MKVLLSFIFLLVCHVNMAQVTTLLPQPQQLTVFSGEFQSEGTSLSVDFLESSLKEFWEAHGGSLMETAPVGIRVRKVKAIESAPLNQSEAYWLHVGDKGVRIKAVTEKGAFYAFQTLKQLGQKVDGGMAFPYCEITDWPAFRMRGYMHDVGRSFIPIEELMEQIALLASYKINVFHWHLTEDIAWRLESSVYPELNDPSNMERFPGEFYKREEVKELLEFASKHQVTVIPEIDMPGHSAAFRRALGHDMQSKQGKRHLKRLMLEVGEIFEGLPYLHLGTDEVAFTDPGFVPEMVEFVRKTGFKVISWNPGWEYEEGEIDMLQLWSYQGKPQGNIPVIDSKFHYINHFDPFADLISLYRSNVLGEGQGSPQLAGAILAVWNDRKLSSPEDIIRENSFYPLMLTFAERLWQGGGEGYFDEIGIKFPEKDSPAFEAWEDFENRLLIHKEKYFQQLPFPYVRQSHIKWNLTPPMPNEGKLDTVFAVEKELLSDQERTVRNGDRLLFTGATAYLRHVWGNLVPAYIEDPQPNHTVYAYTWVYSPRDQQAPAWVSFQDYSRSEKDLPPPKGKWDYKESRIWVNGREIPPPIWKNTHHESSHDVPLTNENFQSRAPTDIPLAKGWNKIVLKLPVGAFTTQEIRLVKWMFTFAFVDGEELLFSHQPNGQ